MATDHDQPPQYTRYRARRRLWPGRGESGDALTPESPPTARAAAWGRRVTAKRVLLGLIVLILGWLALSLLLFLIS